MIAGPLDDSQIAVHNPWWTRDDWARLDPHLRRLREQPNVLPARLVDTLDLEAPGIHTIRGPRQVGKSTDLKLLVQRALREGRDRRDVIYLPLDLLEGLPVASVARTIDRARSVAAGPGRALLLLDEVTAVNGWQTAIKYLWDQGAVDTDVVICTGSSSIDLMRGAADRLPGRRGKGRDHMVLPQAFGAFARAVDPDIPESPGLRIADLLLPDGRSAIRSQRAYGPALEAALSRYLRFGGLPAAVAAAASGAREPSEEVLRVLWDGLVREVMRRGASAPATSALLGRVVRSLGSKTDWSQLAREMDVPLGRRAHGARPETMREYVEFLAAGYFLLLVHFWRQDSDSASIAKQRKVYFGDLLLHTIAHERCCPGLPVDEPALVENAFALALHHRYEPIERQVEGFHLPTDLHVWGTASGGEVDFVCGPRSRMDVAEVKYQAHIDRRALAAIRRVFPTQPLVMATRNTLEIEDNHALVPAHLLLWALG
jgi:predicted AAA+ superfamily ATPase